MTIEELFPVTDATVEAAYQAVFAPWVRQLGLTDWSVSVGRVSARLPQLDALKFSSGAVCGQAIMAAVDTVAAVAMMTTERTTKGTVYQHTHFLRPAVGDDFRIEANVLRFGKTTAFAEVRISYWRSGELLAHASIEFAF